MQSGGTQSIQCTQYNECVALKLGAKLRSCDNLNLLGCLGFQVRVSNIRTPNLAVVELREKDEETDAA